MKITLNLNRILSALVAAGYVVGAFASGDPEAGLWISLFVLLPLACIWFAEPMGRYVGPTPGMSITAASPALFVCIAGWVLLLAPVLVAVL